MTHLLMLDLESTDQSFDTPILEVAAILLTPDLQELGRYETVIRPTEDALARLRATPFVLDMHTKNGLYGELRAPTSAALPTVQDAEQALLDLIGDHEVALAGSGTSHFDRHVIHASMPGLDARLPYWTIDLGPSRRRFQMVTGEDLVPPLPSKAHRAMADIEDDLRHLRELDRAYITYARAREVAHTPRDRASKAVALTEAYLGFDAFYSRGETYVTHDEAAVMSDIIQGTSGTELTAGFMDVAERLVHRVAAVTGQSPHDVLEGVKSDILRDARA